ncbi:phytoene dehydrogenase [Halobacteriales archaeon SW_5_68_122]|nr:MAG: phytoene dehydrogenase [Halobacteriales archaeon SW_5_68_122]
MHVVVAGGGLAGLVAARHLAEAGAEVELFEADERVGGRVRSRVVDGFTLDRGFQVLFTGYPAVGRELDLDVLSVRRFAPGATIAAPGHRSTLSDPLGDPGAAVPTLLNRDVTLGDKLRLFRLQRELRGRDPERLLAGDGTSVREYLADRGFSRAFLERFAEPFYGGITLDRSLSTSSGVFEYTFRMLTEGDTVVPAEGMGAIPAQLRRRAEAAGAVVETGRAVTAVSGDGAVETDAGSVSADAVIVATDPKAAGNLTGVETPSEGKACVTVHCSLPAHQSLDTGSRILLFLSERSADDDALAETVREALSSWYPENHFGELEAVGVDRVEFAQFAQPPGFRAGLPGVDAPDGPVYLAGDYTRWSSIQGAMESGKGAADAVLADLQQSA